MQKSRHEIVRGMLLGMLATLTLGAAAPDWTAWFRDAKYGVFVHYLSQAVTDPATINSDGVRRNWDACVNAFNVPRFADAMKRMGAGYVVFTMFQGRRQFAAPNPELEKTFGVKPSERPARRDLVMEIADALEARGIPLLLYWTGDGGDRDDAGRQQQAGWTIPVNRAWVEKWAKPLEWASRHYGKKVRGWWIDGCYSKHFNYQYTPELLKIYEKAIRTGNPDAIVSFNDGIDVKGTLVHQYVPFEDFSAGEKALFNSFPENGRFVGTAQWHVLTHLGSQWGGPGCQLDTKGLADYLSRVNRVGGVVSLDVMIYWDGGLDRSQVNTLAGVRAAMGEDALGCTGVSPDGGLAHGTLSKGAPEKMTHTASPVFLDGRLYTLYQAGEAHTVENVADPTELMRLSVTDWALPLGKPRIFDLGRSGEDFGSFVQTAKHPPCAQTMAEKDGVLYMFFRGRQNVSLWCCRTFDTKTQTLKPGAVITRLDGQVFDGNAVREAYNRLSGETHKGTCIGNECNIRRFSDGFYYTVICACEDDVGLVVRTKDLLNWESVLTTPDLRKGYTWEHEIFELVPGRKWFSAWRQERLGNVWSAVYDVETKTWTKPAMVPGSIAVKPYLFRHQGVGYLATNLRGPIATVGYGNAWRATLGIFRIAEDGALTRVKTVVRPTGCHYVQTFEDGEGRLYLVSSTDERKLDATQCRSNIAFDRLALP